MLSALQYLEHSVRITRHSPVVSESYKDELTDALHSIIERTQDFTDSAYTAHAQRQNIIVLCDNARIELEALLR